MNIRRLFLWLERLLFVRMINPDRRDESERCVARLACLLERRML
jgi:hypothetical protein